jgi:ankyrin repeat protein
MDQKNYEVDRSIHLYNLAKMTSTPVHQEPLLPPFAPPQNPENVTRSQSGSREDFNVPSNAGLTPLYLASEAGDQDVVNQLLNDGADPSFKELNGRTALHVASSNGWVEVGKILEAGAIATSQTEDGWTPLHFASENGNLDVVNDLLEAGADIRARTNDKWTALHIAALNGHVAVVGQLLQDGAEVNATTTGRHIAHLDIFKLFISCLLRGQMS